MEKKAILGIVLTLLFAGMLTLTFNIRPANPEPGTIKVPDDYSTIQEAINSASPGDTVFVQTGTYYEHLTITKNNVTITGENADSTIIDGNGSPMVVVDVDTANDVKISGFTIQNGSEGIELYLSNGTIIRENTIRGNTRSGITLDCSDSNTMVDNKLLNNDIAIELYSSASNSISNNILSNNSVGFSLIVGSTDNSIFGNTVSYNEYAGVEVWQSGGNTIYQNNFIENDLQVYPDRTNVWDNGAEGNYWSDYAGVDVKTGPNQDAPGSDGIGDTAYVINANNTDHYPLMYPYGAPPPPTYTLTVHSSPIAAPFTIDNISRIAPWSGTYNENASVILVMPETSNGHVWSHWLEGDDTNRTKAVEVNTNITLTAVFIDAVPPAISILSPENRTYSVEDVPLTFTIDESTSWVGYSLNGQANVTIAGNTTLSGLSDGPHSLIVYSNDTAGNIGVSEMVHFAVETQEAEPFPTLIVAAGVTIAVVGAVIIVYFLKIRK